MVKITIQLLLAYLLGASFASPQRQPHLLLPFRYAPFLQGIQEYQPQPSFVHVPPSNEPTVVYTRITLPSKSNELNQDEAVPPNSNLLFQLQSPQTTDATLNNLTPTTYRPISAFEEETQHVQNAETTDNDNNNASAEEEDESEAVEEPNEAAADVSTTTVEEPSLIESDPTRLLPPKEISMENSIPHKFQYQTQEHDHPSQLQAQFLSPTTEILNHVQNHDGSAPQSPPSSTVLMELVQTVQEEKQLQQQLPSSSPLSSSPHSIYFDTFPPQQFQINQNQQPIQFTGNGLAAALSDAANLMKYTSNKMNAYQPPTFNFYPQQPLRSHIMHPNLISPLGNYATPPLSPIPSPIGKINGIPLNHHPPRIHHNHPRRPLIPFKRPHLPNKKMRYMAQNYAGSMPPPAPAPAPQFYTKEEHPEYFTEAELSKYAVIDQEPTEIQSTSQSFNRPLYIQQQPRQQKQQYKLNLQLYRHPYSSPRYNKFNIDRRNKVLRNSFKTPKWTIIQTYQDPRMARHRSFINKINTI